MSNGLKGKVREMVTRMNDVRRTGREVTLRRFMSENYQNNGQALTPEHLFAELGIDPGRTQLREVMQDEDNRYLVAEVIRMGVRRGMGLAQREQIAELRQQQALQGTASLGPITSEAAGGQRFVSPEVYLDPVNRGAVQSTFYADLIVREETVQQPQVVVPKLDLSDAVLVDSNEAATIEEGSISYSTKTVSLRKKAKAIKITYEALQFSSLSLLQLYMEDFGRVFGHTLNGMAVDTLINGDQSDLSEAAAVIGVENTGNGITWFDLSRVAIQFGLIGRVGTQIIGNASTALNFLNLPEVKNKQFPGAPLLATMMRSPLTMPESLYVSTKVAANKVVVQDPSVSLVQLTAQPLLVETDRIIMKQIEGTAMSIYTGFAKLQRNASIVIDGSIAFSGNPFPTYMQPLA